MTKFIDYLDASWDSQRSLLCVGLDPDLEKLPVSLRTHKTPLFAFNREIIDATACRVCAFKPQIAYYAAIGAERQLELTINYIKLNYPQIPVILDAKRGDIGATAKMYALEAFVRYQADAVTVNPYMGGDTLTPFLEYEEKGVIILCRTSNPGSGDIQQLVDQSVSVAHHVAIQAASQWNVNGNVGLVVGATWPREIGEIRKLVGDMPLLIPGVGAQGGDLDAVLANGLTARGTGLLVNVSRAIIYAGAGGRDFTAAVATAAESLYRQINQYRKVSQPGGSLSQL